MCEKEQISQIAEIVGKCDCDDCDNCSYSGWWNGNLECFDYKIANALYNANYRLQSEVIAEFTEAVKHIAEGVKFKNATEKTAFIEMLEDLASVKMKGGAE